MLSTKLMALNMPELIKDYGGDSQLDILMSVDQSKFLTKNRGSPISGFSIDETGKIKSTFNMVSYMKVAPRDLKPRKRFEVVSEDDEEIEEDL